MLVTNIESMKQMLEIVEKPAYENAEKTITLLWKGQLLENHKSTSV